MGSIDGDGDPRRDSSLGGDEPYERTKNGKKGEGGQQWQKKDLNQKDKKKDDESTTKEDEESSDKPKDPIAAAKIQKRIEELSTGDAELATISGGGEQIRK